MMIDRLGGLDPLQNLQNTKRVTNKPVTNTLEDTVSVSQEAKEMAEAYYLSEIAASTPDVRSDLVAKVKDKIKDPNYINSAVISSVADRFLDSIGL
jgi:negative regulator of flagellin synthesis FlgM